MLTEIIIGATVLVSLLCFSNKELFHKLEYNPFLVNSNPNQAYRFVTHAFVHADFMHLLFNMWVLWNFGGVVEAYYGHYFEGKATFYYLLLYLGGVLFAALPALGKQKQNPHYNAVGASGAVSAVLFASILFSPTAKIYIFFIPIGIPAYIFGVLYLALEYYLDKRSSDMIAHDAHYWGAIFGLLFTIALDYEIALRFFNQIVG